MGNFYSNPWGSGLEPVMEMVEAFSPCHITGFFQICDEVEDPLYVGSRGAGVSLRRGVKTIVKVDRDSTPSFRISINGSISNSAEVSEHLVKMFISRFEEMRNFEILVEHHLDVPIGAGLGTSGAAALSLSLALNRIFELGMSKTEAAQLAHIAEVECRTGLGTVIAECLGGVEIRVKAGAPGIGEVRHIPTPEDHVVLCLILGPLSTRRLLTDREVRRRINMLGGKLVDEIVENPTISNFMRLSRIFAENVGLMSYEVRRIFEIMDKSGIIVSMPMFGDGVFTICRKDCVKDILSLLDYEFKGEIIISEIDSEGARVIE
jgi:pantoate kinase